MCCEGVEPYLEKRQKVVILIILIIVFLPIAMTEMELWEYENIIFVMEAIYIIPLELLAIFLCVRFYRAFHNPFFKFQSIALAMGVLVAGFKELRLILFWKSIYYFYESHYRIFDASIGIISTIAGLAGILFALYALLQYRESWEQAGEESLIKRFYTLIPAAEYNRLFWYIIIGIPLLLILPLSIDYFSGSITDIINIVFGAARLPAELLGLLLSLALLRIYKNNLFKYLAAVQIIPLVVTVLSFFNSYLFLFLNRFLNSKPPLFSQIILSHITGFHKVVLIGLLIYALLTYRESMKETAI